MVFDFRRRAVLFPVFLDGADAVGADGYDLLDFVLSESFEVGFCELLENEIVPEAADGVARAFLLAEHAVAGAEEVHDAGEIGDDLAAFGVVSTHAAQPQTVLLGAVEDGEFLPLDKLVAFGRTETERVRAAFESEEELGAVVVSPCAGVDCAAAQADEDGDVFDSDRALELTGAAGGALEGGLLRVVFAEQRLCGCGAEIVEVGAQAENDFLGVEDFAGVVGGAMLGAAAAFDAGVGLEADELREIGAGDQAEVFIAGERRNLAEAAAGEEDGDGAQQQMEVLGVRDDGQKDEQRKSVQPPEKSRGGGTVCGEKCGQVGGHEGEDEQGDKAGFPGEFLAKPYGADDEAADEEAENSDGAGGGEDCCEPEIKSADLTRGIEEADSEDCGAMVDRDECKGAEGPEDEGVGQAGGGALTDDFGLEEHFEYEIANARGEREEMEAGVFL